MSELEFSNTVLLSLNWTLRVPWSFVAPYCVSLPFVGILHRAYGEQEGTKSLKQLHKGVWNPLCSIFPAQESHLDMSKKVRLKSTQVSTCQQLFRQYANITSIFEIIVFEGIFCEDYLECALNSKMTKKGPQIKDFLLFIHPCFICGLNILPRVQLSLSFLSPYPGTL